MIKYQIKVKTKFIDMKTGAAVEAGTIFETTDYKRALNILKLDLGDLVGVKHPKKLGKRVLFVQSVLYKIGGIETASKNIAKTFSHRNIAFCFQRADEYQLLEIGKYCDVIVDDGVSTYEADVAILMYYDAAKFLNRVKAEKVYHQIHADFAGLKQYDMWKNYEFHPHERVNKVLAVSETAQKGLKSEFGVDSVVVPNILTPPEKRLVFVVLARATLEKGIDKIVELAKRFDDAGKDFVIYICTSTEQLNNPSMLKHRRIVLVDPSVYNNELLRCADYLMQLSSNESYCYSVREALQRQVPVIVSRIPEFEKLVKDGKNGYILDNDLGNLDINKIFNHIPQPKPYTEKVPAIWNKVLKGEL